MFLFVFDRRDVTDALVQACAVVPADLLDDREFELRAPHASAISSVLKLSRNDSAERV